MKHLFLALTILTLTNCSTGGLYVPEEHSFSPSEEDEITLWKLCWDDENKAVYPDPKTGAPACKDWKYVDWNREGPLQYWVSGDLSIVELSTISRAVAQINQVFGCELLIPAYSRYDIVVKRIHGPSWFIAAAPHYRVYDILYGDLLLFKNWHPNDVETIRHELGHMLGLQHDIDNEKSLMHPSAQGGKPTLADIHAVRKLYKCQD